MIVRALSAVFEDMSSNQGGLAPYPSGFPPAGSGASSGEASGADRESEYTMLSGRKGLSSSESPLEAAPALSTGKRRMARRLSSYMESTSRENAR